MYCPDIPKYLSVQNHNFVYMSMQNIHTCFTILYQHVCSCVFVLALFVCSQVMKPGAFSFSSFSLQPQQLETYVFFFFLMRFFLSDIAKNTGALRKKNTLKRKTRIMIKSQELQ